jgi:hypothetical protein
MGTLLYSWTILKLHFIENQASPPLITLFLSPEQQITEVCRQHYGLH